MKIWHTLLSATCALMTANSPAAAATVTFFANVDNSGFLMPAAPFVTNRSLSLTGTLTYPNGLPNGVYGAGILTSFVVDVTGTITIFGTTYFSDYSYTAADLSSFSATLANGIPVSGSAKFSLSAKAPYSSNSSVTDLLAIDLTGGSGGHHFGFYAGASPDSLTLIAHNTDGGATISWVPELATWLMMIAGFGAVGTALRHRRRMIVRYTANSWPNV